MLNVIILKVIMLNVVMLSVTATFIYPIQVINLNSFFHLKKRKFEVFKFLFFGFLSLLIVWLSREI
jgi:hypothetical protein